MTSFRTFSQATPRERSEFIEQRWLHLKSEREPWLNFWRDISRYISPFSGRFDSNDHMKTRSYDYIMDDHASYALNILVSGMASGATSPLRPWFNLAPPNDELSQNYTVKSWLGNLRNMMLKVFQMSNTYPSLHQLYKELCIFGTAVDLIYDDINNVLTHHVLTAGEYCIAVNQNNEVDTIYREFQLTVSQAVKTFGLENLSKTLQMMYERGRLEEYFTFLHAIEPRVDRDYNAKDTLNMPYASYYIELGSDKQKLVRESGFPYFPALCPRWDIVGYDPYGSSPTFSVLPDVKELQQIKLRKQELLDYYTQPPVEAPLSARNEPLDLNAGGINFLPPGMGNSNQIKPIINGSLGDMNAINESVQAIYKSIDQKYFVDLFLMLQQTAGDRRTTVEVYGLQEEQRLILGPVTERLSKEVQKPLIQMCMYKLRDRGLIEAPPQELMESGFDIEIQSVFAQAQRAVDINAYDRFISTIQAASATSPDVIDRIDVDGMVDEYADRLGVSYKMLRSVEDAQEIRQQRAQAQQQQAQVEQAQIGATALNQAAQAQKAGAEASMATQNLDPIGGMTL